MKKKHNKKLFIIDTNVLLHDYKCIYNFEENDVIIPIVVLEELDKFKKGNDLINFHAREFTRELDKLSGDMLLTANIPLGENLGNLHIETGRDFSEKVNQSFPERTADHRILAIAEYVCNSNKDKTVVLITKDINLRMKAKSLGIIA
jgi:PhoH-like ATPase